MAAGGTELAHAQLIQRLPEQTLNKVHIISRPTDINPEKLNVLWVQDMPGDMPFLAEKKERDKFDGIVFVSSWQQTIFNVNMGIPFSESVVIKNAIEPIVFQEKETNGKIRVIYHPTPHRGLEILIPVFKELTKKYVNLNLDVYSNFDIYGWGQLNETFEPLYEECRNHPQITYHGSQPNHVVREALRHAHIFSYPCIWRETSCMSAMEAMSAGCLTVAPDYGALPETLANFNMRYDWTEDPVSHAQRFFNSMCFAIEHLYDESTQKTLKLQKLYADFNYSWERRISQWEDYLNNLQPKKKKKGEIHWL